MKSNGFWQWIKQHWIIVSLAVVVVGAGLFGVVASGTSDSGWGFGLFGNGAADSASRETATTENDNAAGCKGPGCKPGHPANLAGGKTDDNANDEAAAAGTKPGANGGDAETASPTGPVEQAAGAPSAAAATGPGKSNKAWWNCDYSYRQLIGISDHAKVPAGYTLPLVFDHADLVATDQSLANGNDVRIVAWLDEHWLELPRVRDPVSAWASINTRIWFLYPGDKAMVYLYFGNPNPGNPPAAEEQVFPMADFFNRRDSDSLGRGWLVEAGSGQVGLRGDALAFLHTNDQNGRPMVAHKFPPQIGQVELRVGMNWRRTPGKTADKSYGVFVQLGDSTSMEEAPRRTKLTNPGVGVNLVWGNPVGTFKAQQGLGFESGGAIHLYKSASGIIHLYAVIDIARNSFDLFKDRVPIVANAPFSTKVPRLDRLRMYSWSVSDSRFMSGRTFDYVIVRPLITPEPKLTLADEEAVSNCM